MPRTEMQTAKGLVVQNNREQRVLGTYKHAVEKPLVDLQIELEKCQVGKKKNSTNTGCRGWHASWAIGLFKSIFTLLADFAFSTSVPTTVSNNINEEMRS